MDYSMTVPCSDCPFRRAGGIRLRVGRVREIAGMMLDTQGGEFPCHKSVDYSGEGRREGEVHCAGALIFADKNDTATQMMRICERLCLYDHRRFTEEIKDLVFDDLEEMLEENRLEAERKLPACQSAPAPKKKGGKGR